MLWHVRSQKLQLSRINRAGYDGVSARARVCVQTLVSCLRLNICRLKCVHRSLYVPSAVVNVYILSLLFCGLVCGYAQKNACVPVCMCAS